MKIDQRRPLGSGNESQVLSPFPLRMEQHTRELIRLALLKLLLQLARHECLDGLAGRLAPE